MPITLKIEATSGIKKKVGNKVKKGEKIGICPDLKNHIFSPVNGTIEDISFNGHRHVFVVKIKSRCRN